MSRVNHKHVKQLIAQKVKTIRDREFFSSRLLAGHFADMAAAQTRRYRYNRRVRVSLVWSPKENSIAMTDNGVIWINSGHRAVTKHRAREDRYNMVCGLFAHELGHVLYTDFLTRQTWLTMFEAGKWYPEKPLLLTLDDKRHEADLWSYCASDPKHLLAFQRLAAHVNNMVEDGYIESTMLNRYPGVLGQCLSFLRDEQFESQETLTQLIEHEQEPGGHIWLTISQIILSYALWGEIKYGDEPLSDERVQVVFSMIGDLDRAVTSVSAKERFHAVNAILVRCWPYIKEFLEHCEELSQNAAAGGSGGTVEEIIAALMSALKGASEQASGDTLPVLVSSGKAAPPSSAGKRAETAQKAAASAGNDEKNEAEENAEGAGADIETQGQDESGETQADTASMQPDESSPPKDDGQSGPSEVQEVTAEETGRIPLEQTNSLYVPTGGGIEVDEHFAGTGYAGAASDIDRLLEQMAERSVYTELETKRTSDLNALANEISYGDVHSGVSMKVHRMPEAGDELKEQYRQAAPPLLHISKQLQRSLTQQLHDKRRGGKQTGLYMGRRLDTHALPRNDGRVFYKTALPNETPELAVALLLDESGSMGGSDRATYARAAAVILYDFCQALDIPVMVYGHSTGGTGVDLYSYAEFDAIDHDDKYRMMDISSRGSNRDGAALRYVAEQLSKRREDIRILILVSDGQPAHHGYYGTEAEADLRGIRQEYQRKGLLFIAAAIGDDKENIQRIYGESYLDITDLNKLPVSLTEVVKRHIRV